MPLSAKALFAASSALSMLKGISDHNQAYANAEAQAEHNNHINSLNRKNAHLAYEAYDNNLMTLYDRQSQKQQALAQALVSSQKQALQALSYIKAKAAGAGLRGNTLGAISREIEGQTSRNNRNYLTSLQNLARQRKPFIGSLAYPLLKASSMR